MSVSPPAARGLSIQKARREELLDDAARLLNARGVSQSTLQELADLRGVTRNALYYYFKDLEDLVYQTYLRSCELLRNHVASATELGGSALNVVLDLVDRCLDPEVPELAALNEYGLLLPAHHSAVLKLYDNSVAQLAGVLDAGVRGGELRSLHAPTVARTIISLIHWIPLPGGWDPIDPADRGKVLQALKELLRIGWAEDRAQSLSVEPIDLTPLLVRASDGFDQSAIALVKRETILNLASQMFTCRGVAATSSEEIASTLGTTKPRVYKYVGDKQTLVAECFARAERIYSYILDRARERPAPAMERLVALLRANAMAQQIKELQPLRYGSAIGALPEAEQVRAADHLKRRNEEYTALFRLAQTEGTMRGIDLKRLRQIMPGSAAWLWKDFAKQPHGDFDLVAEQTADVLRLGLKAI